eukprot:Skav218118  [mRNA]  locus=scaffold759:258333:264065:- [translate_table: standard]
MTQLQYLYLSHTHVVGDLASLQGLAQVQWLYLTNTQVTGDLVSLQNLTELQRLFLKDTHIPGDLSSLQSLTHLQELSLANTQVAGDLGSLEKLRKLQRLNLASTHVAGDIAGLQGMTQMHRLNLANDQVAGNLSSLQGATGMQEFDLSNTSVEGELMVLLPWENVTAIDLQQTKVSGRLSSKWRGRWSKLRSLKLSGSRVEFLPQPDELEGLQSYYTTGHSDFSANAILPQLNLLELSGCPLDGDVKNLLLPLFGCPALATIDAASCGLSGTLTHLKLKMVQVNGRSSLGWTSLLSESLRLLNFASNNVSTIEGIPKQMKVIVLADNSAVDFATGVVKEALTAGTFDHVPVKGEAHVQRLLAASAAHIAVHMQGRIHVELKDGVVMAKPLSGSTQVSSDDPEGSARGSIDWQLANLTRLVEHIGKDSISRSRDLREAMMDRCLVEEAEGSESALAGSKHILFKYARCHSLYMEIVQKLVAVALVSVVNSGDGLQLSLAITLLMAAASGMVQPYFHPQAGQT